MKKTLILFGAFVLTQLTACAYNSEMPYHQGYTSAYENQNYPTYSDPYDPHADPYQQASEVAQIINMRNITERKQSSNNGGGAVIGAILGGIIGNQLGRGDEYEGYRGRSNRYGHHYNRHYSNSSGDRAAATIGGALIGGLIGSAVDHTNDDRTDYRQTKTEITLRLNDGQVRTILVDSPQHLRVGDRVRIAYQQGRVVIL